MTLALISALIGWGGVFVFGVGKSGLDAYFLIYPFLFLLILLIALLSLRLMVVLLLVQFLVSWAVQVGLDWPRPDLNPVQSVFDLIPLGIVVLGVAAYLSFPQEVRGRGVFRALRDLSTQQ
jgi:hypothetical protein